MKRYNKYMYIANGRFNNYDRFPLKDFLTVGRLRNVLEG